MHYVYLIMGEFNTEDENGDFCDAYCDCDKEKVIRKFKDYVSDEKASDFVRENINNEWTYETFYDFLNEEDSYTMGGYMFGTKDNAFYTKLLLRKVVVQ